MNMGEILGWSGGTLLLLMTFVQVAPIKVNPWSWLAKKIGRAINGEVLNEIADIKKEQRETQDKLENIFRMMMSEMRICTASVFCGSTLSL